MELFTSTNTHIFTYTRIKCVIKFFMSNDHWGEREVGRTQSVRKTLEDAMFADKFQFVFSKRWRESSFRVIVATASLESLSPASS